MTRKAQLTTVAGIFLVLSLAVWAARPERAGRPADRGRGEGGQSAEARRGRYAAGRSLRVSPEEQLKALDAIEKHIDKLRAEIKDADDLDFGRGNQMSDAQRRDLRERMRARWTARNEAIANIEEQLAKLRLGRRPQRPQVGIEALRKAHALAEKEKATETSAYIETLLAGGRAGQRGEAADRPARRPRRGDVDPANKARMFSLQSFDGKTVDLNEYDNKIIVLEWFNFECPFSLYHYKTKNTMVDLANKYRDEGVVWFAVNSTNHTTPAANKEFAEKYNLPYPILDDRDGKVGKAYDSKTTPHMYIIDSRGAIVYGGAIDNAPMGKVGGGEEYTNYVDQVLSAVVSNKDIPVRETKPYGCSVKYAR